MLYSIICAPSLSLFNASLPYPNYVLKTKAESDPEASAVDRGAVQIGQPAIVVDAYDVEYVLDTCAYFYIWLPPEGVCAFGESEKVAGVCGGIVCVGQMAIGSGKGGDFA